MRAEIIVRPNRRDVARKIEEEDPSAKKLGAENGRKTSHTHDTFADRGSGRSRRRLRLRSVSHQEYQRICSRFPSFALILIRPKSCADPLPLTRALSEKERERERTIDGRRMHFAKMMLHLTDGMAFATEIPVIRVHFFSQRDDEQSCNYKVVE